jgi:hypothetical protein
MGVYEVAKAAKQSVHQRTSGNLMTNIFSRFPRSRAILLEQYFVKVILQGCTHSEERQEV